MEDKKVITQNLPREISAGLVIFRKTPEGPKFLILYHGHNYWNFPKGKIENEERSFEAALRETKEETGLAGRDLKIINNFKTHERFTFRRAGRQIFKIVIFYLAETDRVNVRISDEHQGYAWFLYSEASKILGKYKDSGKVLKNAYQFLKQSRGRNFHGKGAPHSSSNSQGRVTNLQRSSQASG